MKRWLAQGDSLYYRPARMVGCIINMQKDPRPTFIVLPELSPQRAYPQAVVLHQ